MRTYSRWFMLFCILLPATVYSAGGADAIVGVWWNQEKDAHIELYKCGQEYCGRIVWLKEPDYPADSREGVPGTAKLDHNNPDPALRKIPVVGLRIVHGLSFVGDDRWKGGKIYDPKNGKTYSSKITLVSPERLDLRGYIGISLIGRTAVWERVK
ncbi:MAG: hypothetical protein A2X56_06850 [Nitrospirae bacterium GWC2_57_13]|jgi:uncharacterized protein (DUF2147 family)|nr:MAG: hypothetical protein A2072_03700 [Nitrospirae bacterium GWC1_57_7]OGW27700.1 MAG: hypothetical protein A2X56_06850 [Nitrospirae bacterium GWC2_57_13]OGW43915.1 MAG: hypothetical protein A2X57_00340 [Nitrospirae bacterium GWD2_57_8]HAR46316.1 DUF2147 domain-containing protein [Nitrospiraceae bacterium]